MLYSRPIYNNISAHIENYGFITINQCANMFFPNGKNSYDSARHVLNRMVKENKIEKFRENTREEAIYYFDPKWKIPPKSRMILMNFYSLLLKNGAIIDYFKPEEDQWGSRFVADALMAYHFEANKTRMFSFLIEVVRTSPSTKERFLEMYYNRTLQDYMEKLFGVKDYFPNVLIITDKPRKYDIEEFDIININTKFDGFYEKILMND